MSNKSTNNENTMDNNDNIINNNEIDQENMTKSIPLNVSKFDHDIKQDDLLLIGDALIDQKGLISHHLDSANNFYKNGIRQIITQGFKIEREVVNRRSATPEDKEIDWIFCEVIPTNVELRPPTTLHYRTGKEMILYPTTALVSEKFYSGSLSFSCEVKATAHLKNGSTIKRTDTIKSFQISKVPIIKGSIMCNTYNKSKEALMRIGEDPSDKGGYFVVRGEWAVDCTENITFNQPKIYINEGYGKSRVRCEFISKPGDTYQNSEMLLIQYFNDNTITIEIVRDKLRGVQIPFYLLFRAMGWSNDKEMMDWIIYDYDSDANKDLLNIITEAISAKYNKVAYKNIYNQTEVIHHIVDMVDESMFRHYELKTKPENYHNAIKDVLRIFDTYCLPHIGMAAGARHEKLKFLGLLVRKVVLVWLKHIPPTDRDSYRNKRIHAAGENYAKTFKTYFNQTVVMPIKRKMIKDFNSAPFSQVNLSNLVKSAIYADDFERLIVQTIISGNKSSLKIKRRTVVNRLATQLLNRKNQLNVYATMRQVSATSADSAKQSERASEMRRVHMSQIGYTCVSHSPPEGEKVGINKQMAIFNFIAQSSSSEVLKNIVRDDGDIIKDDGKLTPLFIFRNNLARVYVNGYLVGYTRDSIKIIDKYRRKRRHLEINPHTTVYWDNVQNEIQMFVDVGRTCRALMIVYNNKRDANVTMDNNKSKSQSNNLKFQQGIAVTKKDITLLYQKKKTLNDLLREQKIEYVTPEEQENYYVCPSYEQLVKDKDNELKEYTHCDIPQAIIGITALTAPFGNHNQAPRVTYQTGQAKQTCGYYALNWPYRMDKETFLQYVNEMPLVRTMANKYLFPNGNNVMVAIACYTGFNQEDSLIINKAAIDRGLFDGSKFTYYKTDFEQKEELGNPDASKTDGLKSANYEKLVNGIVQPGTHIEADDVLVGKYMPVPKGKDDKYLYIDRSIVYKHEEKAVVHDRIVGRNEEGMRFAKVSLRKIRPVAVGDKFCLTPDHDVLTNMGWKSIDKVTKNDLVATLNPTFGVMEWHTPTDTYKFDHQGPMYELETPFLSMKTTLNHKVYVKNALNATYELTEAINIHKQKVWFKRWFKNENKEIKTFTYGGDCQFDMNDWLTFIGLILPIDSNILSINLPNYDDYNITFKTNGNKLFHRQLENILQKLNFSYRGPNAYKQNKYVVTNRKLVKYLKTHRKENKANISEWCKSLGKENSKVLLDSLLFGNKYTGNKKGSYYYCTDDKTKADNIQLLAMLAEQSAMVTENTNSKQKKYKVLISTDKTAMEPSSKYKSVESIHSAFNGHVYCIEVPNHIFMVRRNNKYHWTGNSSRSGQKGICALLMREADMPSTVDGIRPTLIFNPHGMPSRMTCAQLIESLLGNLCAIRGTHYDATMFKKVDIESIAEELEQYGMNRYGYERMISGITGEYMDTLIFFGPTFYQRLQKFVADAEYSVRHALTDAVTMQPLDGQGSSGGLRIGYMEKDVLVSHGASMALHEKFFHHSDGYTEYICRCGKQAIVNHRQKIYKCKYCQDNADIVAVPSSWTSKLFMQEMESINVGIKRIPRPFTYTVSDNIDREHSQIDPYDESTLQVLKEVEDMIDDSGVKLDN